MKGSINTLLIVNLAVLSTVVIGGLSYEYYSTKADTVPASDISTLSIQDEEVTMFNLTNDYRASKGLDKLHLSRSLTESSQAKADRLCQTGEWSHDAGGHFTGDIDRAGYIGRKVGENLSKGYDTTEASFTGLVNSPAHHDNIVANYSHIGIGFSQCDDKNYYAIHYGR